MFKNSYMNLILFIKTHKQQLTFWKISLNNNFKNKRKEKIQSNINDNQRKKYYISNDKLTI